MKRILTLAAALLLGGLVIVFMAVGHLAYEWYPQIITPGASGPAIIAYAAYAALGAVPVYLQIKEENRWRSLQSEI